MPIEATGGDGTGNGFRVVFSDVGGVERCAADGRRAKLPAAGNAAARPVNRCAACGPSDTFQCWSSIATAASDPASISTRRSRSTGAMLLACARTVSAACASSRS